MFKWSSMKITLSLFNYKSSTCILHARQLSQAEDFHSGHRNEISGQLVRWNTSSASELSPCCDVSNDALNELHPLLWELLWVVVFQAGSTFRSLASLFVLIGGWRREATEKINGQGRYIPKQYIICVWYSQPDVVTSTQMVLSKHQEHNATSLQSGYQGLCNAAWGRNRQWLLSFWNLAMEFICDWSIHCTLV